MNNNALTMLSEAAQFLQDNYSFEYRTEMRIAPEGIKIEIYHLYSPLMVSALISYPVLDLATTNILILEIELLRDEIKNA